jgi:hypothetical protein
MRLAIPEPATQLTTQPTTQPTTEPATHPAAPGPDAAAVPEARQ